MTGAVAPDERPEFPPATTVQQWVGPLLDVMLLGVVAWTTWWLSRSVVLVTLTALEAMVVLLLVVAHSGRSPGGLVVGAARVRQGSTRAPGLGLGLLRSEAIDLRRDAWQRAEQRAERRRARAAQTASPPPRVAVVTRPTRTAATAPSPWSPVPIPSPATIPTPAPSPTPVAPPAPGPSRSASPAPAESIWAPPSSMLPRPVVPHLVLPTGERVPVDVTLYVGRSPRVSAPDARSVPIPEAPESLSRTHLVLSPAEGGVWVEDVSAHGSELRHRNGERHRLAPGERTRVSVGTQIVVQGVLLRITAGDLS
ncbi:hypothetical protein EII34_10920 [Arachnia propionica]|uniref:FHA domain-containing protein n=1 Tax=Arachnia propionica TaxID=1750 RepID=A0A3P1T4T6_9ACTN|nr:hypothetical protein [Arachnia propionica]RRD04334.1 hypothetical protein EII34_10920 [Arachnia propionica]